MNSEFMEAIHALEKEKGISKELLLEAIETALITAFKKNFNAAENVKVSIDEDGQVKVYAVKEVVEEVEDGFLHLTVEEAKEITKKEKVEIGETVEIEVTPRDFGRIAAQTAKQVVVQKIREAERGIVFEEYANKESDIMTGVIQRVEKGNIFVDLGKTEAVLPANEKVQNEEYNLHDRVKLYVLEVKKTSKGPQVVVSRTHPGLVKRLFELEVPEIHDGSVEIVSISREPGSRTKMAVKSTIENVDPVGACVGQKGSRVQAVVNELKGEKIDIIKWDKDPNVYISNSLSPSKVTSIEINEEGKSARVVVPDYQLSLAIGKEGQNARLAAKLTGWKIDIKSESQAAK